MSQFKSVIDLIRKEKVTLFLGAGFSLKAGAPNCRHLTTLMLEDIPEDEREWYANHPLDTLAKEYVDFYDGNRGRLIDLIRPAFDFEIKDFSDHSSLAAIPHFRRIFTTNYDRLLEIAYGDDCLVIKHNEDVHKSRNSRVTIYKIHGDFDHPGDILLTKDDYFDFYRAQKNELIWDVVKAEFATRPILFIGYSLDDDNIYTLINRVKEQSNGHVNQIFLIAPGMPTHKRKRLEKIGVQYFDAKAEDLFKDLFEELDKNIVHDAQRKMVSEDTFHRYCHFRQIDVELKSSSDKNSIENIRILNDGKHNIRFRVSKDIGDKIFGDEKAYNETILFNGIPIPAVAIKAEEMNFFNHSVNGVVLSDQSDIASFMVSPVSEEISCQIKIPSREFRENVKFVKYSRTKHDSTYILDTDSYRFEMIFDFAKSNRLDVNMKVDFKNKYSDNTNARHWLTFLDAIWHSEKVIFSKLYKDGKPFTLEPPHKKLPKTDFDEREKYYRNVDELEDLLGVPFSSYEAYSPENYEKSIILLCYLQNKIYIEPMSKDAVLSFEMTPNGDSANELQVGTQKYCFGISSESSDVLEFNGYSQKIPYKHELYRESEVIQRKLLPNGNYSVKLKFNAGCVYIWYSDEPGMDRREGMETIHVQNGPLELTEMNQKHKISHTSGK